MGGRLRRSARRGCLVAAGVSLLLALASPSAPAQEEDTVPRPEVFHGSASSLVASVQVDREALLPVPNAFQFVALDGSSTYESSTRQARASLFFPGNGVILGPSLACGTFGNQFPPEFKPILDTCLQYQFPLSVHADDFEPDMSTSGGVGIGAPGDPVSGRAASAVAHAGEDAAKTDAVVQDLRVLGLPGFGPLTALTALIPGLEIDSSLATIGSATSRTHQRIERGVLIVDAEASMSDVRLVGGLIRIGSLRSQSHVTDDAKGTRTATPTLEVSGVTVAGVPAQITDQGLVLGPSSGSGPLTQQLQGPLNELLRALNVRVTILDAEQALDQEGSAVAGVGGLLVEMAIPVEGLPTIPSPLQDLDPNGTYVASIRLGSTSVLGAAFTFGADELTSDVPSFGGDGGFDPGGSSFDGGTGFDSSTPGLAGTPSNLPRTPSQPGAAPKQEILTRLLGGVFDDRIGMLYLALMFATLGLCIVPRLTVPARLPGPHR